MWFWWELHQDGAPGSGHVARSMDVDIDYDVDGYVGGVFPKWRVDDFQGVGAEHGGNEVEVGDRGPSKAAE